MQRIQLLIFAFALVAGCSKSDNSKTQSATLDGSLDGAVDSVKHEDSQSKSLQNSKSGHTDSSEMKTDTRKTVESSDQDDSKQVVEDNSNSGESKADSSNDGTESGLAEIGSAKPEEKQPTAPRADELPPTFLPKDLLSKDVRPLNKEGTVLIDVPRKKVFLKTKVSLTAGALEMLVCLNNTKEHESILKMEGAAYTIHTALVALGMNEGKAAYWTEPENEDEDPKFVAAEGERVDIFVHFVDKEGKLHRKPAQYWIRHNINRYYDEQFEQLPADLKLEEDENLRWDDVNKTLFWYGPMNERQRDELLVRSKNEKYQKATKRFFKSSQPREMAADFLFIGSGFFEEDGKRQYLAEGGYVVCVANFNMAMIDISAESNSQGQALVYEAYTERIPPRHSEVLVELVPNPKTKSRIKNDSSTDEPERALDKSENTVKPLEKVESTSAKDSKPDNPEKRKIVSKDPLDDAK